MNPPFLAELAVGVGVQLVVTLALVAWAKWVARRHPSPGWKQVSYAPYLAFATGLIGASITSLELWRAFDAAANAAPEEKATRLAQAISNAMLVTAVAAPVSWLLYATCLIACVIGTIRKPTTTG